jgi:Tol biopolymer transport system component
MSKLALLAMLSAAAALSFGPPTPKATLLFSVKNHKAGDPAVTADGRRMYYWQDPAQRWQDPAELYMYDRSTRRFSRVLGSTAGAGQTPALSRAGDRLAFDRSGEGGGDAHVWVLSLDPATGLANGEPRRASTLPSRALTFSPDGQWIAFGSPTSRTTTNLIVMPANGGPERVVAETQGDVWPIEWSNPDSIYFGLSFSEKQNAAKSGVYRISASGGKPQLVLHTVGWGNYPGLSPDGRLIISYDSTWETVVVSAASGRRLQVYMAGEATPDVWSTSGKAVGSRARVMRILRLVDFSNGAIRDVSDTAELAIPVWSPDGHRVAAAGGTPAKIVIFDRTAGTRHSIPIETRPAFAIGAPLSWSPDGRLLSYVDKRGSIHVVDPATSNVRLISPLPSRGLLPRWRSDSRALIYGNEEFSEIDSIRKIEIHEVTIDGQDRLLHSLATRCGGTKDCGKIIDDSLMSTWTWSTGEYLVTNFRERGTPRVVYKRDGFQAPQVPPVPTFSSNGRWMAVRHQSSTDQSWSIELMHTDGSAHRSVPVSFPVTSGAVNPWIAPDGAELIVASGGCPPNLSHTCPDTLVYYRVNVASGTSTVVASLPHAERPAYGMIANDGHSLAYLQSVEWQVDFYEFDFSDLLKLAQR